MKIADENDFVVFTIWFEISYQNDDLKSNAVCKYKIWLLTYQSWIRNAKQRSAMHCLEFRTKMTYLTKSDASEPTKFSVSLSLYLTLALSLSVSLYLSFSLSVSLSYLRKPKRTRISDGKIPFPCFFPNSYT